MLLYRVLRQADQFETAYSYKVKRKPLPHETHSDRQSECHHTGRPEMNHCLYFPPVDHELVQGCRPCKYVHRYRTEGLHGGLWHYEQSVDVLSQSRRSNSLRAAETPLPTLFDSSKPKVHDIMLDVAALTMLLGFVIYAKLSTKNDGKLLLLTEALSSFASSAEWRQKRRPQYQLY